MEYSFYSGGFMKIEKNALPAGAAVSAVALWSFSPVLISLIGAKAGAAEIFLIAISSSLIASLVISLCQWGTTKTLIMMMKPGAGLLNGLKNAALAGVFIGLWYFGCYQALQYGPKIETTIIAFIWPLLSVFAMRIFAKDLAKPLTLKSWLLVLASFIGVVGIVLNNNASSGSEGFWGFFWAILAAIGSGLYLPFAVKASKSFSTILGTGVKTTFYSVSVSNVVALITAGAAMIVFKYPLDFSGIDTASFIYCTVIGLGVYLFAEIAWTWAFKETASLTLSSLPYFSPAVSVLLLAICFRQPLTIYAVIGLTIIISSNLYLHFESHIKKIRENRRMRRLKEGTQIEVSS